MKKRIFCLTMAVLMLLTSVLGLASCTGTPTPTPTPGPTGTTCTNHQDREHDGKCDVCSASVEVKHEDADHDGKCDVKPCGKKGLTVKHVDENHDFVCDVTKCGLILAHDCIDEAPVDGICDICDEDMLIGEHDCIDEAEDDGLGDGLCDICFEEMPVEQCQQCTDYNGDNECEVCGRDVNCDCVDEDGDTECDYCTAYVAPVEVDITYPWGTGKPQIIMQLTENTNDDELLSVAKDYLAGESKSSDLVATEVRTRNATTTLKTGVQVTYLYYPNNDTYGWGTNIERIKITNQQGGDTAPDIYCVFIYDMVGASLNGAFANVLASSKGENFFAFNEEGYNPEKSDRGYMYEYMTSLSLAPTKKMYVVSSDYFLDMVRAFFCIPVSIKLMEDTGADVASYNGAISEGGKKVHAGGDRDDSGGFDIEDFYDLVREGEWTYARLAEFAAAAYKPSQNSTGSCQIGDEIVGFAIDVGGLAASGLLYTTKVTLINKNSDGTYDYIQNNQPLYDFCDAAKKLFGESKGVCVVNSSMDFKQFASESHLAIRKRFSDNKVLFGDITLVGALEFPDYQKMKTTGGFGVVPVPVYEAGDAYLTQVHNMGSCGAIATITTKFSECTAFLNYQSTHSESVLNNYYEYNVKHGLATESEGTVEMLEYLRSNVRSSFDKAMEDALGVFITGAVKWHQVIAGHAYQVDIRNEYQSKYATKEQQLDSLAAAFLTFPD